LGYYSVVKIIATAKIISSEMNGVFPDNYEAIKSLKGIGPYTASAIASFALIFLCSVGWKCIQDIIPLFRHINSNR
jgi:hypothetical protein